MSRRGFLKQATALAALGATPAPVTRFLPAVLPAGIVGDGVAAGMAAAAAGCVAPQLIPASFALRFLRQLEQGEEARARWTYLWRKQRVAMKRGAPPKPAKVIWFEAKLRELRQLEAARREGQNRLLANGTRPWRSPQARRQSARTRHLFERAGFDWKRRWEL